MNISNIFAIPQYPIPNTQYPIPNTMRRQSTFSTLLVFAVLTVAGFALVPLLSIRFLPSVQAPSLTVRYTWPDASPDAIEQQATSLLEGAFSLVQGVESIYSVSGNGRGSIRLGLDKHSPRDYLRFEVAGKIRQLYPRLPKGVSYPQVRLDDPEADEAERPLLTWSLSGDGTPAQLQAYASDILLPQLALVPGIQSIRIAGGNREELAIIYDASTCRALGLTPDDLLTALRQNYRTQALGSVRTSSSPGTGANNDVLPVRLSGGRSNKDGLEDIAVGKVGSRIIRLGDVAKVQRQQQKPRGHYRINGQASLRLLVQEEAGVNTIKTASEVKKKMASLAASLPPSYRIRLDEDTTEHLTTELYKIRQRSIWSLGILLVFVLLAYRDWRHLVIILASLTANLGLAAIFYYFLKIELHLYALAAITVSFGIIIDNTVVMAHHLQRQGNLRVFAALLASTLTTLAALVAIWFLPEQWQLNLKEFARVLAINLGVSLLIAVWLVPALMNGFGLLAKPSVARSLPEKKDPPNRWHTIYKNLLLFLLRFRKTFILLVILLFGTPLFLLPNKVEGWDFYNKTLGSDWYLEQAKPIVNKLLGGTLRLFVWYVWERSSFRQPEETVLYVHAAMPPGATLQQMNDVIKRMENYLAQYPREIKKYVCNVASGEHASVRITFNKGHHLAFPHRLKSRLIAFSLNLGGVKWNIYGVGQGFSNDGGSSPPRFRIKMRGYNKDELRTQAERFAAKLTAHPRIREVDTEANINWWDKDRYAYEMHLNRRAMAITGIPAHRLHTVLHDFDRAQWPDLYLPPDALPARLISSEVAHNDLWKLQHIAQNADSLIVFFPAISQLEKRKVASSVHKENQQYIRMVAFEYTGSYRFGSRYLDEKMEEMRLEMPPGYSIEDTRSSYQNKNKRQYKLLLLIIGLIFFICALMFESLP
ncbi:MAG TPA: efflux RND transporter permease subunit, partial [Bacteroidetes bacterium]|nr:efflux RND transporter permease subunit [Bacteroidota bacterium]